MKLEALENMSESVMISSVLFQYFLSLCRWHETKDFARDELLFAIEQQYFLIATAQAILTTRVLQNTPSTSLPNAARNRSDAPYTSPSAPRAKNDSHYRA